MGQATEKERGVDELNQRVTEHVVRLNRSTPSGWSKKRLTKKRKGSNEGEDSRR